MRKLILNRVMLKILCTQKIDFIAITSLKANSLRMYEH